ncbi:hypothetical protein SAMN04488494_1273 [Xylanibacter ruminicola]|uniref:Uncharacterized protein n=1 Tax=Xylanibacter ruminicola TaxID=839 RepID=A0A1M7FWD3_XYLRU|nr:hypothetical protein SAMN04488493_11215 [Xylanibacter ruminicola]SHM07959.1 hypothetical protein SAMN04488494_1273 [Xylanibacter ruminicola]
MIRLGLDPKTPNDIGGSRPTTGGLFFIRLAEIFDVAFGNHFDIMLMMFVINYVEKFFLCILFGGMKIMFIFANGIIFCDPYDTRRKVEFTV